METLSNDEIAQDVCEKLQSIISNYKQNPNWVLPKLRQIVVTRWHTNDNFKGKIKAKSWYCQVVWQIRILKKNKYSYFT